MEQYLYTHLTKKYGLKVIKIINHNYIQNLIISWVASIINAVKMYMKQDSDVALFAKTLKNECD